jgi:hypothetical protein
VSSILIRGCLCLAAGDLSWPEGGTNFSSARGAPVLRPHVSSFRAASQVGIPALGGKYLFYEVRKEF